MAPASRIAVVTGASSGIGAATARQLAQVSYRVVLTARRKDRIEALAEELTTAGHSAVAYQLDVTDRAAVDEFATAFRTIAVLVNNAGGALGADPVATGDPADWRAMYETNVIGTLNLTQALLPKLIASGDGVVVVVSSTASTTAPTRAARAMSPPSTAPTSSPRPSAWRSSASRSASSRSPPAWSRRRSSP